MMELKEMPSLIILSLYRFSAIIILLLPVVYNVSNPFSILISLIYLPTTLLFLAACLAYFDKKLLKALKSIQRKHIRVIKNRQAKEASLTLKAKSLTIFNLCRVEKFR